MRALLTLTLVGALAAVACGDGSSMMSPSGSMAGTTALTGTWVGTASDSSGTMMGASGMSPSMMGNVTWQVTQTGNTFTGVMQFPGYGGSGIMMVSGTIDGKTGTFTMTMPNGSTMTGTCSAVATGTFDLDDFMQMRGTYSGSHSCVGPFDRGQMLMTRR